VFARKLQTTNYNEGNFAAGETSDYKNVSGLLDDGPVFRRFGVRHGYGYGRAGNEHTVAHRHNNARAER